MNEKITFQQLAELLSSLTGGSVATTEIFIKELFALVSKALINGEKVHIKGIGSFMPSIDNSTVEFAPDADLAESINLPFSCFEAIELEDEMYQELIADESKPKQEPKIGEPVEVAVSEVIETEESIVEDIGDVEYSTETKAGPTQEEVAEKQPEEDVDSQTSSIMSDASESNTPEQSEDIAETDEETASAVNQQITDSISDINDTVIEHNPKKSKFALGIIIGILIGIVVGALAMFVIGNRLFPVQTNKPDAEYVEIVDEPVSLIVDTIETDTIEIELVYENIAVDTVKTNRFLTTMARHYYNEMNYWVYIYEENKDKLGNPNKIKPGTSVHIPDIRKYLNSDIDSLNIEDAKLKALEIYAPYQK